MKQRSEQAVNYSSLLWLAFGIGIFWFWTYAIGKTNERAALNVIARETRMAELFAPTVDGTVVSDADMFQRFGTATPTPPATETPAPVTPTVQPTATAIYSVNFIFTYSYYNPKLGGANCATWDYGLNDCVSMMANGEDWHDKYGKVVACPPEIALGTVIEVLYPDALKGHWICKDRGGAIVNKWIDFLDITQRAAWGEPVAAILYPPTMPLEQITAGSH